jgi:hypothetical protein
MTRLSNQKEEEIMPRLSNQKEEEIMPRLFLSPSDYLTCGVFSSRQLFKDTCK